MANEVIQCRFRKKDSFSAITDVIWFIKNRDVLVVRKIRNKAFIKLRRKRLGYRFVGWWFLILGLFMSVIFGQLMLDPEGVINYNGIDTTDFDIKLNSFLFTLIFPVIGFVFIIIPKQRINKLLVLQARVNPFSSK